jgi:hypothetical protein
MGSGIATSAACLLKAGDGVSLVFKELTADTNWNLLIGQAEAVVNTVCRYNYSDAYAALTSDAALILEDTVSNLAAINAIQYDMAGYTSRTEAEDMINVLRDSALRNLSLLRDKKVQDWINGA